MKRIVEDLLKAESIATADRASIVETDESSAAIENHIVVKGGRPVSNSIDIDNFDFSHDLCKREILKLQEKIKMLEVEIDTLQTQVKHLEEKNDINV